MTLRIFLLLTLGTASASAQSSPSRLTNVSVRSTAGSGAETLIVGFAIGGSGQKSMLIRGVGPALGAFGVPGVVTDPQLQLFSASGPIAQNDDWDGAAEMVNVFTAVGAFALPAKSRDAALLLPLAIGSYTAQLTTESGPGIALVECYDADTATPAAYIRNVSARSVAGTGASVLTVGFAITGSAAKTVLIRGVGPALSGFGVPGTLANPELNLFNATGVKIGLSDDWGGSPLFSTVFTSVGAFALSAASLDAAILVTLPPGAYTAQVSGVNNTTGAALIEVYETTGTTPSDITLRPVLAALPAPPSTPATQVNVFPRVLTQSRPTYPFEFRRAGVTGEADIVFIVKTDGTVRDAVAIRATDARFAEAAVAAVLRWTFVAAQQAGRPVEFQFQVPIIFSLN